MFTEQFNDCSRNYLRDLNMKMARLVTELGIRAEEEEEGRPGTPGVGRGLFPSRLALAVSRRKYYVQNCELQLS